MKKILLIILFSSCIVHKTVVYEEVMECNDEAAFNWIEDCVLSQDLDSSQVSLKLSIRADCIKQARELFCKKVKRAKK